MPAGGGDLERAPGRRLPAHVARGRRRRRRGARARRRRRHASRPGATGCCRRATASASVRTGSTGRPATSAASAALPAAAAAPAMPRRRRPTAIGSTPRDGDARAPSSESSPTTPPVPASRRAASTPAAARMASAIGRSNAAPALRTSAGARFTVMRCARELEARVADRCADAVAALAHAGVGQPDHREQRQAERDVDLDGDGEGLDAAERGALHLSEHAAAHHKADASARRRDESRRKFGRRPADAAEPARCVANGWQNRCAAGGA